MQDDRDWTMVDHQLNTNQDRTPLATSKSSKFHSAIMGTKEKPISAFTADECSTREDLVKVCFTLSPLPAAVASSSSSNASLTGTDCSVSEHGIDQFSINAGPSVHFQFAKEHNLNSLSGGNSNFVPSVHHIPTFPTQVQCAHKSRVGRENQRYETCPDTGELIRLVTGCVPITNDGSILFVSSAKKREWILPKGGWEKDETLEESALRETYEESGVLGTLGPLLSEICYETRKGRKRRIEEMSRKAAEELANKESKANREFKEGIVHGSIVRIAAIPEKIGRVDNNTMSGSASLASVTSLASSEDEEHAYSRAREIAQMIAEGKTEEDINKIAPKPKASICKMRLFPMYVSEVLDVWPECGRTRKVVPLDEAIQMASRPEIKEVLLEIKRRNLHLPLQNNHSESANNVDDQNELNNPPAP